MNQPQKDAQLGCGLVFLVILLLVLAAMVLGVIGLARLVFG